LKLPRTLFLRFSFFCFFLSIIFTTVARGEFTHIAKKGESLSAIAQKYHISISRIQEANDLENTRLQIGQRLIIPKQASKVEAPSINKKALKEGDSDIANSGHEPPETHVVKKGETLVGVAQTFLGVKYRRGGTSLVHGLDCSAFVQKVFRVIGVDLPRTAREQFEVGLEVARDALRLGDLVFFKPSKGRRPAHVGIYIGNEQFIHTSLSNRKVKIDSINTRYFSTRFIGGRRIEEAKKQPELARTNDEYSSLLESNFEPIGRPSGSPVP